MAVRSPRLILSVLALLVVVGVLAISCSNESPTSPASPASAGSAGKATISGTLVNATPQGQAGDPLPGVTVRAAGTRQSAQTDEAGRFTLSDLPAGQIALEFRGPGFQSGITVNTLAGQTTRVTVALNRGRSTVTLLPRSEGNGAEGIVDMINTTPPGSFLLRTAQGLVPIQTNSSTLFRMEGSIAKFSDLKVGLRVEVEGARQTDGSIVANRISLEGVENPEATRTPTPTGTITPNTPRPTRTPEIEDEERTRTATPTGTITPNTPRPTRTPEVEGAELEGTVGNTSGSSFVLTTESGNVIIQTNSATQFRKDGGTATFADIKTGVEVEVEGTLQADKSVLASRVSIKGD